MSSSEPGSVFEGEQPQNENPTGDRATEDLSQMLQFLLEDRRRREEDLLIERRLREEEMRRERDEREADRRHQLELFRGLMESLHKQGETTAVQVEKAGREQEIRLGRLTESDDIEAYLTTFERQMQVYDVDKAKWSFKLAPQLSGRAQQAYVSMGAKDSSDYDKLKEAILVRYDITDESYRQRLRTAKLKQGESNKELQVRLRDLTDKWMRACTDINDVKDKIVLEQLLETLPLNAKLFVKKRKPATSEEAARLADDYISAHKDQRQTVRCNMCKKLGHYARECRDRPELKQDATKTEKESSETKPLTRPKRDIRQIVCFNCHKKGHVAMECPDKALLCQSKRSPSTKTNQDQLQRVGTVGDHKVTNIVLDTGVLTNTGAQKISLS